MGPNLATGATGLPPVTTNLGTVIEVVAPNGV